jgi:hypothetical protein
MVRARKIYASRGGTCEVLTAPCVCVCVLVWRTASSSSEGTLVKGLKRIGEVITHNAFIGIAYTYSQLLYNVTVVGRFAALDVVRPVHREKRAIL